jgi:membrane protein implicated in regulation of membrane protease activity
MDWHSILETTFLVMFWVGLVLTVVMGVMSGAFHHEIGAGSSFEGGVAHDLGGPHLDAAHANELAPGKPEVGWSEGEIPGFSPWSPTVICATLTGAGGLGWVSLTTWDLGPGLAALLGIVGGLGLGGLTFGTLAWVFKRVQSSSHVAAADLIGREATVSTAIESSTAGAISCEASGGRMVVPARSADAAPIPTGARVEIVRVEDAVYHVRETRDSWLSRSKGNPAR